MKFLLNSSFYWPAYQMGGPIFSVAGMAEELVRRGHEVTVVVGDRDVEKMDVDLERGGERNGVRVRYFESQPTLLQRTGIPAFVNSAAHRFGPEFHQWVRENVRRFDVVHTQMPFLYSSGACSKEAVRQGKVYLYSQRSNLDRDHLRFGYLKKKVFLEIFEKPILRRADTLIALTEPEVEVYRELGCKQPVEVIPNGIDPNFAVLPEQPEIDDSIAELLAGLGDRPVFLLMSRIHPEKGPEIFADAFVRIARERPDAVALYAGFDELGVLENDILPKMREAGLSDRLRYLGPVRGDTRLALLNRCDAFVLPARAEGFSMVILEALACGCAVITTPGARFPELARAGAGLIVDRTVEAVAEGMARLSEHGRAGMAAMGERGRDLVQRDYSWSTIASRYEEICSELHQRRDSRS